MSLSGDAENLRDIKNPDPASFKDPIGNVYVGEHSIERSCKPEYVNDVLNFLSSPLYEKLISDKLILEANFDKLSERFVQEKINYWIYPFESSFLMLKKSALATLEIQHQSILHGYTLKDASAYNVCFKNALPVHVDLYSFEKSKDSIIWSGYDQFCREYLNPLILECYTSVPFQNIYRSYLNGISSHIVSKLLPWKSYFNSNVITHAHLKSYLDLKLGGHEHKKKSTKTHKGVGDKIVLRLVEKLIRFIENLNPNHNQSEWSGYGSFHSYSTEQYSQKQKEVEKFFATKNPEAVIDYGCNTGEFTRIIAPHVKNVIGVDADAVCIDKAYESNFESTFLSNIHYLVQDLSKPTTSLGWNSLERRSFTERFPAEGFSALAFVHHLRIACNVPTSQILSYFKSNHSTGVLEYVSTKDPMSEHLLQSRSGVDVTDYTPENFKAELEKSFVIENEVELSDTRKLYMLRS